MTAQTPLRTGDLTRRRWLGHALGLAVGGLLAACAPPTPAAPTSAPAKPTEAPKPASPSAAAPSAAPATTAPAAKAGAPTKVTFTEGAHVIGFSPLYLAMEQGFFRDEGLDVELTTVGGGAISVAAVTSGSALLGFSGGPEAVDAARKGSPIRIVATSTSEFASNVIANKKWLETKGVTRDSPLEQRVKALKGAKIAITSPGSSTDQLARFLLKKYGMNPDTDVELLALRTGPPILAALKQGTADVVVLSPPTGEQAVAEGFGTVLINPLAGEVPEIKGHIFHIGSASLRDIQQRPQLVKGAIKAIARAERMMRSDKANAKRVLQSHFKDLDPAVFDVAYENTAPAFPANPIPTRESIKVAFDFTALFTGEPVGATYEQVVDPKLAEDAVRELGA